MRSEVPGIRSPRSNLRLRHRTTIWQDRAKLARLAVTERVKKKGNTPQKPVPCHYPASGNASRTFAVCRKSAVGFSPMRNLGRTTLLTSSSREISSGTTYPPPSLRSGSTRKTPHRGVLLAQDDTRGWRGEGILCLLPSPSATPPPLPKGEASVATAFATLSLLS